MDFSAFIFRKEKIFLLCDPFNCIDERSSPLFTFFYNHKGKLLALLHCEERFGCALNSRNLKHRVTKCQKNTQNVYNMLL